MSLFLSRLVLVAVASCGVHGVAGAATLDPAVLIETWLLPRYDTLVATAAAQRDAWAQYCDAQDHPDATPLRERFAKVADAWNAVEFVTMGPVSQSLRADRFNFFPDRRQAISRAVAELLRETDAARLQPDRFPQSSAAAQGLPALERLLFDPDDAGALRSGAEAERRCALGAAIALNLATIAVDLRTAWGDRTTGLLSLIVAGRSDPALFPDVGAVSGMILTDLAGAYQRVSDTRILPVVGSGPSEAKPLLADGWRAGRSGRVVAAMIESADALLRLVAAQLPARPRSVAEKAANAADVAARAFPADLGAAAQTADGAATIQAALKVFKTAQRTVYRPVASYFDISLGFNALDGD